MPSLTIMRLERRAGEDRLADDALLPGDQLAVRIEAAP